jgi:hypothetical protein
MRTRSRSRLLAPTFALALLLGASACSDDTNDKVSDAADSVGSDVSDGADSAGDDLGDAAGDVREDVEDGAGVVGARAQAEALRASLKGNDTANAEGVRSVAAIEQAAADLPGDVEVSGVEDTDGDGLDDDGRVQVDQGDQSACVILPPEGEDTTVESGAC